MDDGVPNWIKLQNRFQKALTGQRRAALATCLGVSPESLDRLRIGWSEKHRAWTFPERDHEDGIIGIQRRFEDGTKRVIRGSRRGLYLPDLPPPPRPRAARRTA